MQTLNTDDGEFTGLCWEPLEERLMLSGVVIVVYDADSSTLLVMGDSSDNDVTISTDADGVTTVTGQDGTYIVGDKTVTGEITSVVVDMDAGNDTLVMQDVDAEVVAVQLGDGDDSLQITGSPPTVAIDGGNGDDAILVQNAMLASLSVTTGAGNDTVTLDTVTVDFSTVLLTGDGADTVNATDSSYSGFALTALGSGDDAYVGRDNTYGGLAVFLGGSGTDSGDSGGTDVFVRHAPIVNSIENWS